MKQARNAALCAGVSAAAILWGAGAAWAQEDTIVVTARKRAENIQKIPTSITALGAEQLIKEGITDLSNITDHVPNLYFERFGSGNVTKIFVRGIGVDNSVFSFDSPIGIYVDGVYFARALGSVLELPDVERIEFLRGPQGTLYGRNNTAGSLRVITKKPLLDEAEAMVQGAFGSKDQLNFQGMVSAPLIEDKLGARLVVSTKNTLDGWMKNLTTGEDALKDDLLTVRGSLLFAPSDRFEMIVRGDYLDDKFVAGGASSFVNNPDNDLYTFEANFNPSGNKTEAWGTSAETRWSAGGADFTSIAAYRELSVIAEADADGTTQSRFQVPRQRLDEYQFTEELFATWDWAFGDIETEWTAGAFYLFENNKFEWSLEILSFLFGPPGVQFFDQDTNSAAGFLEVNTRLTDRLTITTGARYTYENKDMHVDGFTAAGAPAFTFDDDISAYRWTWKASADYAVTDNFLAYFQAGTGFRSGGFDGSARNEAQVLAGAFGPETAFSVEGGFKSEWLDRRVRLNAAYYYVDYEGLQFAITTSAGIAATNVNGRVHGLEAELSAFLTDKFRIDATFGTQFDKIDSSTLALKNTPEFQGRLGMTYTTPAPKIGGTLTLAGDISYTDDYHTSTSNDPVTLIDGYELANASLSYQTENARWTLAITGRNLTDQEYPSHMFNIPGLAQVALPTPGRRYLATVTLQL